MMTTEQLTNLRWLLANGDTLAGSHELSAAAANALPELLDAAEREAKLREALEAIMEEEGRHFFIDPLLAAQARAALAQGGAS